MKKLLSLIFVFLVFTSYLHCEKIRINIPSFDESGNIVEEIYSRDMPSTYEESLQVINLLLDVYNEVNTNYKNEILENEKVINSISEQLSIANEKINTLEDINNSKDLIDDTKKESEKFNFNNLFGGFGIIGEYGTINNSNEISLMFGVRVWKFTLTLGPDIMIPRDNISNTKLGFRSSLGFWF